MINIKKIIKNILNKNFKLLNLYEYKNILKIKSLDNYKIGNYQIIGLKSLNSKILNKEKEIKTFIYKIKLDINNLIFINKLEFIKDNFINIFIKNKWIKNELKKMLKFKNFNISSEKNFYKTIIVDYSSPNMSKEMHIGHLRSIILGDTYFRISKFLGFNTIKINHIGDWGLNFGMIIQEIKKKKIDIKKISIEKLEKLYINSKKKYNKNQKFKEKSNKCFSNLTRNNKEYVYIWKHIIKKTINNNNKIYKLLNIKLNNNDIIGESFYQKFLPMILRDLKCKKLVFKKKNKIIYPIKELKNKEGKEMGIIIRKKYNIYSYISTEIASIRYRCKYLLANKIIYYTDIRQKDHIINSHKISKSLFYINNNTEIKHNYFGMILNDKKSPLKTRDGNNLKLKYLIKKCLNKYKEIIIKKNKKLNKNEIINLSKTIGIGSLKYFDLSKNRLTNYVMDLKKMFSSNENTLIYIQYNYIRIVSILKKINENYSKKDIFKYDISLETEEEIKISLLIIKFKEVIYDIFNNGFPNNLCLYIYNISKLFSSYYNKYKIINNNKIFYLIIILEKIIKKSLYLLGINVTNKM